MTDGIIQKVFNRYLFLLYKDNRYTDWYELQDLKNEIIQQIKKEAYISKKYRHPRITLKKLIGDNID